MEASHNIHCVIQDTGCRTTALCGYVPCRPLQKTVAFKMGVKDRNYGVKILFWLGIN